MLLLKKKSNGLILLLVLSILMACIGVYIDACNTLKYGGIDLRNRVVGARLLVGGHDPYYFKWNEEYSDRYLDLIDRPEFAVNRVTVPPTVLMMYSFFSNWDYKQLRIFWFIVQWMSLLLCMYLLASRCQTKEKALLVWISGLFLIACSDFWRFHVERGQVYILYSLLLAISYYLLGIKHKYSDFLSGVITGFAIGFRLPIALMAIPVIYFRKFSMLAGMAVGCASSICITLIYFGIKPWISYFTAMYEHGLIHLYILLGGKLNPLTNIQLVENMDISNFYPFLEVDTSLQGVFGYSDIALSSSSLLIIFSILLTCLIIYLVIHEKRIEQSDELIFLLGTSIILVAEFFIPAFRFTYNNVIWIVPIALIIISFEKNYFRPLFYLSIALLLSFLNVPIFILIANYWVAVIFMWFSLIKFHNELSFGVLAYQKSES